MASTLRNLSSKVLLLLIGVVAAVGIAAFSPSNAYATEYDVYVGGVQVTDDNMDDVLGDGTVELEVLDSSEAVLTLTDASIPVADVDDTDAAAIYIGGSSFGYFSIVLEGDNEIYMPDESLESDYINGITCYVEDELQIAGHGSLAMSVSDFRSGDYRHVIYGIFVDSALSIYDVSIDMYLSGTIGANGVMTYGETGIVRSDVNIYPSVEGSINGFVIYNDFYVVASRISVSSNQNLVISGDAYGITADTLSVLDGSDVSVQLPEVVEGGDEVSCAIYADYIEAEYGSSLHAYAGWCEDESYGIYLTTIQTINLEIGEDCYLDALGYTRAFNDNVNYGEDVTSMGAHVNYYANPRDAVMWNKSTDLCEYKYVSIPVVTDVYYCSGVEGDTEWQPWVYDGAMSGTSGQGLRMEGLRVELSEPTFSGGIEYKSQLQSDGWEDSWTRNGETSGYDPQKTGGKRLEAVQIRLYGEMSQHFDVWYHLQVQRFGWMGWVKNGETAGSVGYGFRVEAIEIMLTPKGMTPPSVGHSVATPEANMLSFVRCRSYDNKTWQSAKGEGDVSGTRNQTKTQVRVGLAASSFNAAGIDKGNSVVQVRVYQDGKWSGWSSEDDAYVGNAKGGPIRGIQARLKSGSTLTSDYDLYYRVEVKDGKNACWLGWAKNGQTAGQSNINLEQIQFSLVKKGNPAPPANAGDIEKTTEHSKQRWVIERWPCNWPKPAYRF